jgi:hypothetical protein
MSYGEVYKKWLSANRDKKAAIDKAQRERHVDRFKSRDIMKHALRDGKIIRGICEVCGDPKTEGHHDDYSQPLRVRWLCKKHHQELTNLVIRGKK